mmetsp:Transcript_16043/g.44735  ORF Transcript_16043/g.44735 Transcript_16043/m.44735 type:complete len:341 (-) Transcript_16043:723-1745(-)
MTGMVGLCPRSRFLQVIGFLVMGSVCLCVGSLLAPYVPDAFFYAVRHSRPLRGSCIPRGEGPGSSGPVRNTSAFGILSFHHKRDAMRDMSWQNKVAYCKYWGYTCMEGNSWYDSRAPKDGKTFTKLHFIKHVMESPEARNLEWLFWIDGDAIIANMGTRLSDLLQGLPVDDNITVLAIATDALSLNTGVFLLRNSPRGRGFLLHWMDQRAGQSQDSNRTNVDDQRALISIYNSRARELALTCTPGHFPFGVLSELSCHDQAQVPEVLLLPPCAMNSGPGLEWKPGTGPYLTGMYMHGDFVVHFFGQGHRKMGLVRKAVQKEFFWSRRRRRHHRRRSRAKL